MENMKRILCYLLWALYPTCSFAQIQLNQGAIASTNYFDSVSYKSIKEKVIIPVTIEGTTYQFILDTGAPFSISQKLYNKITTHIVGNIDISDANGAIDSVKVISVPKLNIGKITFLKTRGIIFNKTLEELFGCFNVDGIIGSNMLRNSVLQIDSKHQQIILTNHAANLSLKKKYAQQIITSVSQSNPFIKIGLQKGRNKANETLLFDTGAEGFYDMSIRSYRILNNQTDVMDKIAESYGSYDWGMNGFANQQHQFLINIPKLKMDKTTFQNVVVTTTTDSSSRIGATILKYGIVTIDYLNKRFYFQPYERANTKELSEKPWPIAPILKEDKMVVGIIWNPDLKKEINLGDEILQSGDTHYDQMSFCKLVISDTPIQGEKMDLLLRDVTTGKIKKVTITRM
jgi:hypothetical protein